MFRMMLRDDQWTRITPLLRGKAGDRGLTRVYNRRRFVEAVFWIARTGSPWRDLSTEFWNWNSIYACVEGLGQLARFVLTGGQVHDATQAMTLLKDIKLQAVLADKAYDSKALLGCISEKNAKAVIPPKANRKAQREFDTHQHKHRNLVERFFAHIKQCRRVATRYNKLAERIVSIVAIAASMLWLK